MTPRETGAEIDSAAIGRALVSWACVRYLTAGYASAHPRPRMSLFRHGWQEASF